MLRLIEIKLDKQGNKIFAIVEEFKIRSQRSVQDLIELLKNGQSIINASLNDDELIYIPNERRCPKLKGQTFGELKVIEYLGNKQWKCECSCGKIKSIATSSLTTGKSQSCGHNKGLIDLKGQTFGKWYVLEYAGEHYWKCKCLCGCNTIRNIRGDQLRDGKSTSCSKQYIKQLINKHNTQQYINIQPNRSDIEEEIALYVESLNVNIQRNNRTIFKNIELDIYIPDYNIAIEVNGDYWHSTYKKDKNYHLNKTLQCEAVGIRLVHIFEHEWKDKNTQQKLKTFINKLLHRQQTKIYARDTTIKQIDNNVAAEFISQYHLQGTVGCEEAYGLYYNNELIQVMTFGKSRYNTNYDAELLRLCSKADYEIIGGASKLFKHYTRLHPTYSILSYCNHTKFTGEVYKKLGMIYIGHTSPDYIYIYT